MYNFRRIKEVKRDECDISRILRGTRGRTR